jgi:cellulose biosynthesis protein BcsQ
VAVREQAIAVMNGKGGVGKTSLVANLAGLAAASGWRTLAVDLDQQGNLENRLGYQDRSDQGAGLCAAFAGEPLTVIADVRPGLDVIAGGTHLRRLPEDIVRRQVQGEITAAWAAGWFDHALADLDGDYDLIVVDTPPSGSAIHRVAATAAHYVVVPTAPDRDSMEGLAEIALLFEDVLTSSNPDIELLGVALTLLVRGASAVERRAREELATVLATGLRVFGQPVHFAQRAAVDMAERGVLAFEYEARAADAAPWYAARAADDRPALSAGGREVRTDFSSAATGLASDYQQLAQEILGALTAQLAAGTAS